MEVIKRTYFLLLSLLVFVNASYSQIRITLPLNRAVYQRGTNHRSTITVAGSYDQRIDKVEARFIPVSDGQGTFQDWVTVQQNPTAGNFSGVVSVLEGWYTMEVRASWQNNIVGDVSRLDRVGVGEVFIISGQSNAEGIENRGEVSAASDRVNCFNGGNDPMFGGNDYIKLSPFSKLDAGVKIAPRGRSSWCWGKLGDLLVSRLNVPVMFFNTGFNGTSVAKWQESAEFGITSNPYIGGVYFYGMPYSNLRDVLKYYATQLGARAVLWMQGETDNTDGTPDFLYRSRLQTVIQKSRDDFGKNISWVVAQESASALGVDCGYIPSSPSVLNGQFQVITSTPNVFFGPVTDGIQNPGRSECNHFSGQGLIDLANAWNGALNSDFFDRSIPHLPEVISANNTIVCNSANSEATVTLPDGYQSYDWSNSSSFSSFTNSKVLTVKSGTYYIRLRDSKGRILQMAPLVVNADNPGKATISPSGIVPFCEGESATLTAQNGLSYNWSNGSTAQSITVNENQDFYVQIVNIYGCKSDFSNFVAVRSNPLPPAPSITNDGATTFCEDIGVRLNSSGDASLRYLWSNGESTQSINVFSTGTFSAKVIDKNGCKSPSSSSITTFARSLPPTPVVSNDGTTTFCEDSFVTLKSTNLNAVSYKWSTGEVTQNIKVAKTGIFSVRTVDTFGCISRQSNNVTTLANPLPPSPNIISYGDTVFCGGGRVDLSIVNNALAPNWVGLTNKQNVLTVDKTGLYQAYVTDKNGCNSKPSNGIFVSVKPNPEQPVILRASPYTLEAYTLTDISEYVWDNLTNTQTKITTTKDLRVNADGSYRLTTKIKYPSSYGEKVCVSTPSSIFNFSLANVLKYDDQGLAIFPNPTTGLTTLETRNDWKSVTVTVYTMDGKKVFNQTIADFNQRYVFNFTNLGIGEYIIKFTDSSSVYEVTKRLLVSR
ncbi:Por secretion system C-terminal sorting domain-containing protein [Pseudarcicella hirudinis]|uniref:Por secretion system C-terminal sorting domain-containing protein n=1 Tax=Pseudarcicella hirudinis TaxID=1079859 RepID=A0A1I5X0M4_9BACT|nr:sialate O-acetylesterase [Pseudarcicella hirudinis]SFQ25555.1 Por secretion system C-terminal sorting domain-containing protein [Pseudarcicella hirudinis]